MDSKYDVVIIGAGIGGLVCGCYLAKAGLKVLIVEKHWQVGGYCTSFNRGSYRFDAGIHYFGGLKNGALAKIIKELGLDKKKIFYRFDPTDKIIFPNKEIYFRSHIEDTIKELQKAFPNEQNNITRFFDFITKKNLAHIYLKTKNFNFQQILDSFFVDYKIKACFEVLLSNLGLPAKHFSGLSAILLYKDYLLDGGYYPKGGMQGFADILAKLFKEHSGNLFLETKVEQIKLDGEKVTGIILEGGKEIKSKFIVSNADAHETFKCLLKNYELEELRLMRKLKVSPSIFAVYLGLDVSAKDSTTDVSNIWDFNTYEVGKCLSNLKGSLLSSILPYIMISFPSAHDKLISKQTNKKTVQLFVLANFETRKFWEHYKNDIANKMIDRASKVIPDLKKRIKVKVVATPQTFYKYTQNYRGSAFGWSSTVGQIDSTLFPQESSLRNLILVGHWCSIGSGQGGIPKVAFSGRRGAKIILNRKKYG